MIRSHRSFLLTLLLPLQLLALDSMNVALYGKPFVYYKGSMPLSVDGVTPDPTKMNPDVLIDENYFNYIDFPIGPVTNIGSGFGVSFSEPKPITSIAIFQLFNSVATYRTRVRTVGVWGSSDSVQWTLLATVANTDTMKPMLVIPVAPAAPLRSIRVELISMDFAQSSVVSELKVYSVNDSNYHRILSVSAGSQLFQNGGSSSDITWTSENHHPTAKVNILFRESGEQKFSMVAENELNDGKYILNTTGFRDGDGSVRVEPVSAGNNVGSGVTLSISNYGPTSLLLKGIYYGAFPVMSSAFFKDSIELMWTFRPNVKSDYRFRMIFSTDSGRTWVHGPLLQDSTIRKLKWGVPSDLSTGLYSFLGIDIMVDTMIVSRMVSRYPQILIGKGPFQVPWSKVSNYWTSSLRTSIASVRLKDGVAPSVVLGPEWMVQPSGGPISSFSPQFEYSGLMAVADINGNNSMEIVSRSVRTEDGSVLFSDTLNSFGSDPQLTDIDGDGSLEVITTIGNTIWIRSNTGALRLKVSIPATVYGTLFAPVIANIDGTPEPEIITGMFGQNQIFVFRTSGISVPGYPLTFSDLIQSAPMAADLDKDGKAEIIVLGQNTLWCFDETGNVRVGFPVSITDLVNRQFMSIADINNDSYLDIIFTSARTTPSTGLIMNTVHCIDRFGKYLAGWPATITDGYRHFRWEQALGEMLPASINGVFSLPYIVSVNGDSDNEIIFFSTSGYMYVFDRSGKLNSSLSAFIGPAMNSMPDFSDVDGDGRLNAYIPLVSHEMIYNIALDFGPNSYNPNRMPWPTYRQNIARTGIPPQPLPLGVSDELPPVARSFALEQNYPNPFNPSTTISFAVPESGPALLTLHDVLGREVRRIVDERLAPGRYSRTFTADGLNSGVYFYTLMHGTHRETKRMTLIK